MHEVATGEAVLAQERRALDRWAAGDPAGYVEHDAEDATYFDDIGAQSRVDGIEAVRAYMGSLAGKVPPHRYELADPKVQLYGDVAVVTLGYRPFGPDGGALTPWKATCVYRLDGGDWRRVHAHWSMIKQP